MKYKIFLIVFFFFLFFSPKLSFAISSDYEDVLYNVVGEEVVEGKVNVYFFYGDGCPHCAKEEVFLDRLEEKYSSYVQVFRYETWNNSDNASLMLSAKALLGETKTRSVPFTVIGNKGTVGYNDYYGEKLENQLLEYLQLVDTDNIDNDKAETSIVDENKFEIPLLGKIDAKDTSVGIVAIVLGLVDGFNPCAMWVLLFLINMLIGMENKRRMFLFGFVFLLASAFVYFLSMLGISTFLSFVSVPTVRSIIGLIAVIVGIYNVRKYIITKNDNSGCHVVDDKKRKKIFNRIKKFTTEKNIFLALFGVILLAISVNAVELACSTVFPATFAEILAVNEISGIARIIYLLIYTLFYMIDDMVVFVIAVSTLTITTASTKYGKLSSLFGGIIMLLVGVLLIFKPEWIMFNF